MDKPILSIIIPVYNHEKYIKQCIESVVMQETEYTYEVLIGEDCSKDGTKEILSELQKKLPDNFKFYFREKNLGVGINGNASDLIKRAVGKYIIVMEGDDYWTYNKKIQKQVHFLEEHEEYVAVYHNCQVVDINSQKLNKLYPECKEDEYSFKHFLKGILPGQLATLMYRREIYSLQEQKFNKYRKYTHYPADRKKAFILMTCGKIRCMQKVWSAYRYVNQGGSSFSATWKYNNDTRREEINFYKSLFEYSKGIQNQKAIDVSGRLYFETCFRKSLRKDKVITFKSFFREVCAEQGTVKYIVFAFRRFIYYLIKKVKG